MVFFKERPKGKNTTRMHMYTPDHSPYITGLIVQWYSQMTDHSAQRLPLRKDSPLFCSRWQKYFSPLNKNHASGTKTILPQHQGWSLLREGSLLYIPASRAFSSLAWAFICCSSIGSGLRRFINNTWLPTHSSKICINQSTMQCVERRESNAYVAHSDLNAAVEHFHTYQFVNLELAGIEHKVRCFFLHTFDAKLKTHMQ